MKKVIAALLSIMMLLAGTTAFADNLDDIKAAGKLVVGTEATFAPYEFYYTDPETGEDLPLTDEQVEAVKRDFGENAPMGPYSGLGALEMLRFARMISRM